MMLQRDDVSGCATAAQSLMFTLALSGISTIPFFTGLNGQLYLTGALILNALLFWLAVQFLFERNRSSARGLFFASIIYLPLLLGLMVFTKA